MVVFNFPFTMYPAMQQIEDIVLYFLPTAPLYKPLNHSLRSPSPLRSPLIGGSLDEGSRKPGLLSRMFVPPFRIMMRIVVVLIIAAIAAASKDFGFLTTITGTVPSRVLYAESKFIDLMSAYLVGYTGCLSGFLAFVLPPVFYLRLDWVALTTNPPLYRLLFIAANIALAVGAAIFSVVSTVLVVVDIV